MTKLSFDILSTFDPRGTNKAGDNLDKLGKKGKQAGADIGKGFERGAQRAGKSLDGLEPKAGRAGRKAGDEAGKNFNVGFSKNVKGIRVGSFMKTGMGAAAGLGAGLAFADAFGDSLARGSANAKLRAQLDLSAADSKRLGKLSGELYASNYGESVAEVSGVVRKVVQDTNTAVKSADLKPITAQVISLANAFEEDFGRVTRAAGQMVKTGLAKDTQSALDVIARGFQKGADKSEDFLDTLNEYDTQFRKLGISGATATGILIQGLQAGARDADIVADALKEFSIRAVDGSKLTADGFKALGLDAEKMATKIGKGGKSASEALDLTLDKLRGIKDPVDRAQVAVGLFGTQAEDLGDALFALDASKAVEELGKVGGAAKDLDKTLGDTNEGALKTFLRGLEEDLTNAADTAIEAFGGLIGLITDNETAMENAGANIRSSLEDTFGEEAVDTTFAPFRAEVLRVKKRLDAEAATKRIITLRGDIKDLDRKIKKGEQEIEDVPKSKRTDFKADIEDLKRKRAAAQREINKLKGKTVTVGLKSNIGSALLEGLGFGEGSAEGGLIPGAPSSVDNHLRPMATGEFVVKAKNVNARTRPVLEMINEKGIPPEGLAGGGVVGRVNYLGSPGLPQIADHVRTFGSVVDDVAAEIQDRATALASGPGRALGFAKAQVGKPYGWGQVGPNAYDCSGFMSAILNVMQGRYPHTRRGTTASFPWPGFAPGMGPFAIGSTRDAGGGIGHMAGSLFGVPVESRGGVGPIVGSGALSATSGMFGGPWHVKTMDRGGMLAPKSATLAINKMSKPETVFPGGPRDFGEAVADALIRRLEGRGKKLEVHDVARRADLFARTG